MSRKAWDSPRPQGLSSLSVTRDLGEISIADNASSRRQMRSREVGRSGMTNRKIKKSRSAAYVIQ